MPLGKLKEWIYTGAIIEAKEALAYGWLEKVVAEGEIMEAAWELAIKIASKGPLGVAAAKKVLNRTRDLALEEGLELESDFWSKLTATQDMKEGAKAFIEKRKPNYTCR
jgi:enoyl-CoA hydratase/carnithine racemase